MPNVSSTVAAPEYAAAKSSQALFRLQRILKSATQDLWLDTIRRASAGVHDDLIFWMLDQTECDFAVAAHAFYRSNPAYHLDNPRPLPLRPAPGQMFAQVLVNWDKGYYRTHKLLVEPRDAFPRAIARLNQKAMARPKGSLPFTIPARLLNPVGGEPLSLPSHMSPADAAHLWPVYHELRLWVPSTPPGFSRRLTKARDIIAKFRKRSLLS